MEMIRPDVVRACRPQLINGPKHWWILHMHAGPVELSKWDGGCSRFVLWLCKVFGL